MRLKDLKESLHPKVELWGICHSDIPEDEVELYHAGDLEHRQEIENILGLEIPQWYIDFITSWGLLTFRFRDDIYRGRFISTFDLSEVYNHINDYYINSIDEIYGMLPIGNDMGSLTFFYAPQEAMPGIYVSWQYPDPDFFIYLAPTLQSLITDDESVARYLSV